MSEREKAQLLRSDTATEDDAGDEGHAGLLSKSGLILLFGSAVGSYIGGMMAYSGVLSGVGIRALFSLSIVLALDRVFEVQREWLPRRLKQRFSRLQ